ncbi:hypothetical protein MANES_08G040766v8 [Manihot esculenta]|uniref:Uncharacterized protein n=1 Tax=Manihot esculenta TaxID=3983 RepID=A0ACB7H7Y8_MANES|nr:hypothetical protein MANES_08G040766v8 [Manihot esculenta]
MVGLSFKHFLVLLLVFSGELIVYQTEGKLCNDTLKPLPGSGGKCVIYGCLILCDTFHKGSLAECVNVSAGSRCVCTWQC